MKISVTIKNIYGVQTIYPACPQSALMAELAGTKTLIAQAIALIKKMGYEIEVFNPVIKL